MNGRCDICGVIVHEPHTFTSHIDNRLLVRLRLCVQHRELLRDLILDAAGPRRVKELAR